MATLRTSVGAGGRLPKILRGPSWLWHAWGGERGIVWLAASERARLRPHVCATSSVMMRSMSFMHHLLTLQPAAPKAGTPEVAGQATVTTATPRTPTLASTGPNVTMSLVLVGALLVAFVAVYIARAVFSKKTTEATAVTTMGQSVVVTDVQMPFGSMVVFMVKWALASIPAVIILFLLGIVCIPLGVAVVGALLHP